MPFLLRNVPLPLDAPEDDLRNAIAARLRIDAKAIRAFSITRRSIDARKKDVHLEFHVEVALSDARAERAAIRRFRKNEAEWITPQASEPIRVGGEPLANRPIVIGFGPGGMFAALRLAELGYKPLVLERGRDVRRRHRDIMQKFYREHVFDETSNLLFGEGGAGTYSDGKLYTRIHDPLCQYVLEVLYQHGASPDILVDARPHIGSDRLPTVCTRIRERVESLGGEIRFECCVDDIRVESSRLTGVHIQSPDPAAAGWHTAGPTILAVGHSARDTIRMLHRRGVTLVPKPFQIGVRIEHPQSLVDRWQLGQAAGHQRLGAAEYHLVAKGAAGSCGDLFSFCMCPGGVILPTNESAGLIATNGASRSQRSGPFANAGLVITLDPRTIDLQSMAGAIDQFPQDAALRDLSEPTAQAMGTHEDAAIALRAMAFQQLLERLAFLATDQSYRVPAQRATDFLQSRRSDGQLETSYPLGGQWCDLAAILPAEFTAALRQGLATLDARFPGFAGPDALITAPETRASAPVRILRDPVSRQADQTANLYPVGEGAGYAGGIVSAAVDGLKTADAIIAAYAPPR